MASEKKRYRNKNREPEPPISFSHLRTHLPALGQKRLADILWFRAENDVVLWKILTVATSILAAENRIEFAKTAVDFATHFPDYGDPAEIRRTNLIK